MMNLLERKELMEGLSSSLSYKELIVDNNIAKISIVGVGMRSNAGVRKPNV
jgi:aspartokinase